MKMKYVAIAPKKIPFTIPSSAKNEKKLPSNKDHIVFLGKGQRNNPQFVEIMQHHKDAIMAARKLTRRYNKLHATSRIAESIYESWTSQHTDNCFVRVDEKKKRILEKHDALRAIPRKCELFFREQNFKPSTKKEEKTLTDSSSSSTITTCRAADVEEDSDDDDDEYGVFMV